jgi:hypothetical protein
MSDALKNRKTIDEKVITLLRKGKHQVFIASECGCSINKVYSIRKKLLENGEELLGGGLMKGFFVNRCKHCGKPFRTAFPDKLYCSAACAFEATRDRPKVVV